VHYRTWDTPDWDLFLLPWDEPDFHPRNEPLFKSYAVLQIIHIFVETARNDKDFLTIILEANFLGLLRRYLQQEFEAIPPYMARHCDDRLMVYDTADLTLLAMIREHGLKKLLPPVPHADMRRAILLHAFDTILRHEGQEGEGGGEPV
jgi:hypothetical protein